MKSDIYRHLWIYERLNVGHHLDGRKASSFKSCCRKEFSHPFNVSVLLQSRLNFPRHDFEDKNVSHVLCQQILSF